MLLPLLLDEPRSGQPFILLQSTAAQSILPVLRGLAKRRFTYNLIFAFLYAPSTLIGQDSEASAVQFYDWTGKVPGYDSLRDIETEVLSAIDSAPEDKSLNIIIDSLETLSENFSSTATFYEFLHKILRRTIKHTHSSQLIIHSVKPSDEADLLLQTDFSSSLVHLTAHPTSLLLFLSGEFMVSPPPVTPDVKFWSVFLPFSERTHEIERLSFGLHGEGSGTNSDMVIEILVRGSSGKRGFERVLEGWNTVNGLACSLSDLQDIKPLFSRKHMAEAAPDPTQNLSFNLSLNTSQQQSRAQVPLPYAHEGHRSDTNPSAIFYDPESADDIDDDDPDDDLDI